MSNNHATINTVYITFGLILIIIGAMIAVTTGLFSPRTVKEVQVNEASTDWYVSDNFLANKGDELLINVNVGGGTAKLRVDEQNTESYFQEVQGSSLSYNIAIEPAGNYHVHIWTRAWPWTSNYVSLTGSIALKRVFVILYLTDYAAIGAIGIGSMLLIISVVLYLQERMRIESGKKLRTCPNCSQKVPIENPRCPHCGFDVNRSIHCKYCNGFYDRSLPKCPNCGAKSS